MGPELTAVHYSAGFYNDAAAALDFVLERADLNSHKVLVFGRSLGGAVAVWLASQPTHAPHILCLIIENTFSSLPHIAAQLFNSLLLHLPRWVYKNKVRQ